MQWVEFCSPMSRKETWKNQIEVTIWIVAQWWATPRQNQNWESRSWNVLCGPLGARTVLRNHLDHPAFPKRVATLCPDPFISQLHILVRSSIALRRKLSCSPPEFKSCEPPVSTPWSNAWHNMYIYNIYIYIYIIYLFIEWQFRTQNKKDKKHHPSLLGDWDGDLRSRTRPRACKPQALAMRNCVESSIWAVPLDKICNPEVTGIEEPLCCLVPQLVQRLDYPGY